MYTRDTFPALVRVTLLLALLFAMIQVALSVGRIYSVLPGFRLLGTVTSVPGPETAFSCCIECARDPANCDASHFNTLTSVPGPETAFSCCIACARNPANFDASHSNTLTGACELVVYGADPLSIEAAAEWVLYYTSSLHLSLTFGAIASASSLFEHGYHDPSWAVDGDRRTGFDVGRCAGTISDDYSPWLQVDLTAQMNVQGMVIWNRRDSYEFSARRLKNITIYVSPTHEGIGDQRYVCGDLPDPPDPIYSNPINVTCGHRMAGRYIRIHKTHDRILHLCELELILC